MLIDDLKREWVRDLAHTESPWPGLPGTLDDVVTLVAADPDHVLAVLLTAFARGDRLAGRVVVQTLLPKICRFTADGLDAGLLIGHLWIVAAEYPLTRRPRRIAANLALDARKRTLADRGRELPLALVPDLPFETPGPGTDPDPDPVSAPAVLRRAAHLELVTPQTHALLVDVYGKGMPTRAAARLHGLSEAATRQRCSKAVRRLAAHRLALVA